MNKTESELREILQLKCKIEGRKKVAEEMGVSEAYISMLVNDHSVSVSQNVAAYLGYRLEKAVSKVFVPA